MADISERPWGQFSAADYGDAAEFCRACLINTNEGSASSWAKGKCKLPVREPKSGALNRNGVHAAAARLAGAGGGVDLSPADRRAAARKLLGLYAQLKEDAPESIRQMAS